MKDPIIDATWKHGQSIWLDFISRKLIDSGELAALVDSGLRGLTSNPTIFQSAVAEGTDYDKDILLGLEHEWDESTVFEHLAVSDIARAADILKPVYDESGGTDGFCSIEVSPRVAHDTEETITEAMRLWKSVNRPNVMVKVPGTKEGIPAIRSLLGDGLNVNITLLFSLEQYSQVLETYIEAIERRLSRGYEVSHVASVASFFVSRVDGVADKELKEKGRSDLAGRAAIANACLAYRHFESVTSSDRWKALAQAGAQLQRPLWASTSTKNPEYSDVLYVQELVAQHTVNTMPLATLNAWKDHGRPEAGLRRNLATADAVLSQIQSAGVDVNRITQDLIEDGVKKFSESFDKLLDSIRTKMKGGLKMSGVR